MKENNIALYVVLAIAVTAIISGVFYLYVSSSQTIDTLYGGITERDTLIAERDNTIAGLREEIVDLRSAKDYLASKLDGETLAKEAIRENLNTLEGQFKDAAQESIRVEGQLTKRANDLTVEVQRQRIELNNASIAETEAIERAKKLVAEVIELKISLDKEVYARSVIIDQLQRMQAKLDTETVANMALQNKISQPIDYGMGSAKSEALEDTVPASKYNALVSENQALWAKVKSEPVRIQAATDAAWSRGRKRGAEDTWTTANAWAQDQQIAYDALIIRIEDSFVLKGDRVNNGKSLQPFLFVPADLNPSPNDLEKNLLAIERATGITRAWYQNYGLAFKMEKPIVFKSNRLSMAYNLSDRSKLFEIIAEDLVLFSRSGKAFIVFMYNPSDTNTVNFANWWQEETYGTIGGAVIRDYSRTLLLENSLDRYVTIAVIAHEIGHIFGLPDLISSVGEKTDLLMKIDESSLVLAKNFFPLATLSEQEKEILRRNLAIK